MASDLSWLLMALPVVFALGWFASRLDLRQLRIENRAAPKAYFRGLNFLLNEQQDKAIDAFIEAVQNDPDTSELHFALGNLFRRRGEYERAVRVHEHLLSRADLTPADRQRAQHALALDFLKAGLLDRAEDALRRLENTPFEAQARLALLAIYERSRDWPKAAEIAKRLEHAGQGSFAPRLAHYLCEQADALIARQQLAEAQALLATAMASAPGAARAYLTQARIDADRQRWGEACDALANLHRHNPDATSLFAQRWAEASVQAGASDQVAQTLRSAYEQSPSLDVLDAIVWLDTQAGREDAREGYLHHLQREPSLVAASKWIAGEKLEHEQFHPEVQRALDHAVKPLTRYRCAACGFEAKQHFWQCPGCQAWDSYPPRRVEEL